jgi:hypothetical protein
MDDFEQRLSRQPLRQVPAEWREEILDVAATRQKSRVERHSFLSTLNSRLSTIFWPHPTAWAGLAAVWIFILAVDFSQRDLSSAVVESHAPPPLEIIVAMRQQQRLLAELLGPRETRDADRQTVFPPKPRSECGERMAA